MAATENKNLENRVLVLMPTGRDADLICATLEKVGIAAEPCADAQNLTAQINAGAGAILLAEEALERGTLQLLSNIFDAQPVWSDLPVVLFAGNAQNAEILSATVGTRFNATIVERPIRIPMLISAVRGALRARDRQYQSRNLLNQLEESDRQKDLFLATLSHELRTPLNSILGWIQLLRNNSGKTDANRGLEVIERNAKAQSEIISDILFVSQIITGKLSLEFTPVNVVSVVQEAVEMMLPSIKAKELKLRTFFETDDKKIKGNADRLKQVFWNILSNAVKFTPPQGQIDVRVMLRGANVEVEINDSGEGIESEFLPYIFERFRQADSSYTRKFGGLGLGLAIVRHLVEIHGGRVNVRSSGTNLGASFSVTLPVLENHESATPENSSKTVELVTMDALPAGVRILLVEDNTDSREMLKVLFEQFNVEINTVSSVAEAMSAINQKTPDVLISDIGMPGEDGYELIRRVRQLPPEKGGRMPAIALTGYASQQDRELALNAGYQEHFSKPIDVDGLIHLVGKLLKHEEYSAIC